MTLSVPEAAQSLTQAGVQTKLNGYRPIEGMLARSARGIWASYHRLPIEWECNCDGGTGAPTPCTDAARPVWDPAGRRPTMAVSDFGPIIIIIMNRRIATIKVIDNE